MQFELTDTQPTTENETTWFKWYDHVKEVGDKLSIPVKNLVFKIEKKVFYIFTPLDEGTSVFAEHHKDAKFTDSTPDGVRLANAIGRFFKLTGTVGGQDLCDALNAVEDHYINVEKTEKGRLWTISKSE